MSKLSKTALSAYRIALLVGVSATALSISQPKRKLPVPADRER